MNDLTYSIHEAGHCVTAFALGVPVIDVQLCDVTQSSHCNCVLKNGVFDLPVLLGGIAAELILRRGPYGSAWPSGFQELSPEDWNRALRLIDKLAMQTRRETETVIREAQTRTTEILITRWEQVRAISDALRQRRVLSGAEAWAVFQRQSPPGVPLPVAPPKIVSRKIVRGGW